MNKKILYVLCSLAALTLTLSSCAKKPLEEEDSTTEKSSFFPKIKTN